MIDILLVVIVAWAALLGYAKGGLRTLVYASAAFGALYMIEWGSPWLHLVGYDLQTRRTFILWLARVLQSAVPVGRFPPGLDIMPVLAHTLGEHVRSGMRLIYEQTLIILYAGAVSFGLLMALRTMQTIWPDTVEWSTRRWTGITAGAFTGLFVVAFIIHAIGIAAWTLKASSFRQALYQSVMVHAWTHAVVNGIFNEMVIHAGRLGGL